MNTNRLVFCFLISLFPIVALAGGGFPANVQIEEAIQIEIAPVMNIPGTVISRDDSRISLEVEGAIKKILEVGDRVEEGDVLVEVDATFYQLELQEFETSIMPIEAQMSFSEREAKRLEKLAMENNAAKNRLDEVQSNYQESLGELKIAKTKIKQAKDKIRRTRILAPFSGVITERFKAIGEYASPGDDVIRLVNQQNLEIQARAPQYTISFIQGHNELLVFDEEHNANIETKSQIRTVVPVGDRVSRLYELRLMLNDSNWMAGHSVKVAIPTGPSKKVIAVVHDALVIRRDGLKVYRINSENIAEMVPVTTGIADRSHIEIIGDINAGDKIVIRGNERLRPGQEVQIQERTQ